MHICTQDRVDLEIMRESIDQEGFEYHWQERGCARIEQIV